MIKKLVILLIVCFINISSALAITEPQKYTILDDFYKAMEKFKGSNVSVAYEEFSQIVNISPKDNDYINIVLTGKLSDIGFYSLANRSRAKIVDFEIAQTPLKNIDEIYYQTSKIEPEDEIYFNHFNHSNSATYEDLSSVCKYPSEEFKGELPDFDGITVVCGSLYMIAEVVKELGIEV